jgi:hypothetical protein
MLDARTENAEVHEHNLRSAELCHQRLREVNSLDPSRTWKLHRCCGK